MERVHQQPVAGPEGRGENQQQHIQGAQPAAGGRGEDQQQHIQPVQPAAEGRRGDRSPSLLTVLGFVFLTFNSFMAAYKFSNDLGAASFVVFSYLDIVLLFYSQTEVAEDLPNAFPRRIVRMSVWMLTALLTIMFGYKLVSFMPLPMAAVVWAMAAAGLLGGFYAFHMAVTRAPQRQIPL